jgi:hypothetical protein
MLTDREIEAIFGFNPAPGDVSVMWELQHRAVSHATTLTGAADGLDRASTDTWKGHGHDSFEGTLGNLRRDTRTAGGAHEDLANALYAYVSEQESGKSQAQALAQQALAARQALGTTQGQVSQYNTAPANETDTAKTDREQNLRSAQNRVTSAQADLDGVMRRARALQQHLEDVAGQAARRISAAAEQAPYEKPGWLQQAWNDVTSAAGAVWKVVSSPEFLHGLSTVLNIVSAVLAFIPGMQIFAIGAALLAVGVDVLAKLAAGEPINLLDVALDIGLAVLPMGRMARLFRGVPGPLREAIIGATVGVVTGGARDLIDGRGLSAAGLLDDAAFGATVGVVGHGVSSTIQERLTVSAARGEADLAQGLSGSRRPGAAGALVTPTHDVFPARSGTPHDPPQLHDTVQNYLDHIQMDAQGNHHGNCVEPQAISDALNSGATMDQLKGSTIQTVDVRRAGHPQHGVAKPPCPSCQPLLDIFGIRSLP